VTEPLPGHWRPRAVIAVVSTPGTEAAQSPSADPLLVRLGALALDDARRPAARELAIQWYLPMTEFLARRFSGRGEPLADLTQVAAIGLIKAVDRYDAGRGVPFASYAIPTILGEIKRHFRDTAWTVRVPRRLQELRPRLGVAFEELAQARQREPSKSEVAVWLGVSTTEAQDARRSARAFRPVSFDEPVQRGDQVFLVDPSGGPDPGIEAVENLMTLHRGLAGLSERDLRVVTLRYAGDLTQAEIAADVGLSQMQISRILARSLLSLRESIDGHEAGTGVIAASRVSSGTTAKPIRQSLTP
jgi:RNA polymerase sigma-B factor